MDTDDKPGKPDASSRGCLIVAACFFGLPLVVVLLLFVGSAIWGDESSNDEGQAIVACEDEVRERLKAPSTADLRSSATQDASGRWTVVGTVDAQNSFGATVRNEFRCGVGISGDYAVATITSWQ